MADIRALDGISFSEWFEGHGGSRGSIKRMWDPIGEHRTNMHTPCAVTCSLELFTGRVCMGKQIL